MNQAPSHDAPASTPPASTQVVIVGGGPVGSALAVELGLRGVDAVVVERRRDISRVNVRARGISIRSMEHFRRYGVASALRARVGVPAHWRASGLHVIHESIAGHELFRPGPGDERDWREIAAEPGHYLPQYATNAVLRDRAAELGVPTYTGWQAVAVSQDSHSAYVSVRAENGTERAIAARYAVGADGGQSLVRAAAGIDREESASFGQAINVNAHIPGLFERLGTSPSAGGLIINAGAFGFFVSYDLERWGFMCGPYPPGTDLGAVDVLAEAHCRLGAVVPVRIESATPFDLRSAVARTYRAERLLLAGDAAHLFPPHLGQNLNVGIGDAADLGWKLAAIVCGWGGRRLLDSYTAERRPIAADTAQASAAVARGWGRTRPLGAADHQPSGPAAALADGPAEAWRIVRQGGIPVGEDEHARQARRELGRRLYDLVRQRTYGIVLDERYDHSPLVVTDGTPAPPWSEADYQPSARPGHRAPHAFLPDGTALYDLFGTGFTLLDLGAAPADVRAIEKAAADRGVPLRTVALDAVTPSPAGVIAQYETRLVLVRPDQHVAWRGDRAPRQPTSLIDTVRGAGHLRQKPG